MLLLALPRPAAAEPLRLRADALAQTRSPVGLLVLQGNDKLKPWIDAEMVTWLGVTDAPTPTGDVLSLSIRMRHPQSGSELRVGRQLVSAGAIRPVQLDGMRGIVRAPWGTAVEAFTGAQTTRGFEYPELTWVSGGRVSQSVRNQLILGASLTESRTRAETARSEVGADFAFTPTAWSTTAGRSAFDLVRFGVVDALLSTSIQNHTSRLEVFVTHRSPGRLLPATSLFSVLGDYAATSVGGTARRRLFPRLEVIGTGSLQRQDSLQGGQGLVRTALALDDDWAGSVGLEARRVHFGDSRWSGVRATSSLPVGLGLRVATEIELVVPDRPRGRGALWPWGLLALGYRSPRGWDVSAGVEASSGRTYVAEVNGLARFSYAYDVVAQSAAPTRSGAPR